MSNETRRQTLIVGAFLIVALVAVSPFLLMPHTRDAFAQQADRLPAGIKSNP